MGERGRTDALHFERLEGRKDGQRLRVGGCMAAVDELVQARPSRTAGCRGCSASELCASQLKIVGCDLLPAVVDTLW